MKVPCPVCKTPLNPAQMLGQVMTQKKMLSNARNAKLPRKRKSTKGKG